MRIFEIARVFRKDEAGAFIQNERVGGLVYGSALPEQWGDKTRTVDFFDLKGDVEDLLAGREVEFVKATHPALHPGRTAEIKMQGQIIGFMGELHPQWLQKYDLPQAALVFELDMAAVLASDKITYQTVSKFQAARRDLAFVLPEHTEYAALLAALRSVKSKLIQEINVFDVYRGVGLPEGMKSLAVKVMLQDNEATLTDEVLEPIMQKLIEAASKIGAQLRA